MRDYVLVTLANIVHAGTGDVMDRQAAGRSPILDGLVWFSKKLVDQWALCLPWNPTEPCEQGGTRAAAWTVKAADQFQTRREGTGSEV